MSEEKDDVALLGCPVCGQKPYADHSAYWTGMRWVGLKGRFRCNQPDHMIVISGKDEVEATERWNSMPRR